MTTPADYAPRTADDVTDDLVAETVRIVDSFYGEGRIDWEDVFDRLERTTLDDGRGIDLGNDLTTPALTALKRRVRAARKEQ